METKKQAELVNELFIKIRQTLIDFRKGPISNKLTALQIMCPIQYKDLETQYKTLISKLKRNIDYMEIEIINCTDDNSFYRSRSSAFHESMFYDLYRIIQDLYMLRKNTPPEKMTREHISKLIMLIIRRHGLKTLRVDSLPQYQGYPGGAYSMSLDEFSRNNYNGGRIIEEAMSKCHQEKKECTKE